MLDDVFLRGGGVTSLVIPAFEELTMFGDASRDSLAPESETGGLELSPHVLNDVSLTESSALTDFIKACAVMPSHADDGITL